MRNFILASLISLLLSTAVYAENTISDAKKALIDTLLDQTGQTAIAVGRQFSDAFIMQMTASLKRARPDIDPKAFIIIEEEVQSLMDEELVVNKTLRNMMYPIYDKHFTDNELKQMIEFNKTELGQKIIRVMPQITQEGMQAGRLLGQSLGPEIQQRIAARFQSEGIQ